MDRFVEDAEFVGEGEGVAEEHPGHSITTVGRFEDIFDFVAEAFDDAVRAGVVRWCGFVVG